MRPSNLKCLCRFHRIHSRYEEATAKRCQSSGTHLSLMSTGVVEVERPDFKIAASQPESLGA